MGDERCGVCGTQPPSDARFCHSCGASMHVAVVDLGGGPVDRETAAEPIESSRLASRLGVLITVLAVAGATGWFLVGGGTDEAETEEAEEEQEPPEPTPTAPVQPDPTATPPLEPRATRANVVEPISHLEGRAPVALLEVDGRVLLVTTPLGTIPFGRGPGFRGPVELWWHDATTDEFVAAGVVPGSEDAFFGAAAVVGDRIVVAGTADGVPTMWSSTDASSWTAEAMSAESTDRGLTFQVSGVAGIGDTAVVVGAVTPDFGPIWEAVPPELGSVAVNWGLGSTADADPLIAFFGPFGIPLFETTFGDLELDPDVLFGPGERDDSTGRAWVGDDSGWTTAILDQHVPGPPETLPNGEGLVAAGWGRGGPELVFTSDGVTWTGEAARREANTITSWDDQLVVATWQDVYVVNLRGDWESLGLSDALSLAGDQNIGAIDGAGDLLAVAANEHDRATDEPMSEVLLVVEGAVLRFDPTRPDGLWVMPDDGREFPVETHFPSADGVEVDIDAGTVGFADPSTGELVVTVSIDDLALLEARARSNTEPISSVTVATFEADQGWSYERRAGGTWPARVLVSGDRVFVAAIEAGNQTGLILGADTIILATPLDRG